MIDKFFSYLLKNQVIFALFILICAWFIIQIRDIVISVFVAYIVMAAILPLVTYLKKKGLPQPIAVIVVYLGILAILFALVFPIVPFFINQIQEFIRGLPRFLDESAHIVGVSINTKQVEDFLTGSVGGLGGSAVVFTGKIFEKVFSFFTIIVVSLYLLLYHGTLRKRLSELFQRKHRQHVEDTVSLVEQKLGAWLRGQLLLCAAIGITTWIALIVIGLFPGLSQMGAYALPLGVLGGFLEILPTLGPIIAAIPAVLVALTISPTLAVVIILVYFAIQSLETHILVPKIMQHAVGLNPLIVIISVIVGSKLLGIGGALLAVPFVSFLFVIFESISNSDGEKVAA